MTLNLYRLRKWSLTAFVAAVSALGLFTGHVESVDWRYIAIALVGAYGLDKWAEVKHGD